MLYIDVHVRFERENFPPRALVSLSRLVLVHAQICS